MIHFTVGVYVTKAESGEEQWLALTPIAQYCYVQGQGEVKLRERIVERLRDALRRATPALEHGTHRSIFGAGRQVMAWLREADGARVLCVLNVGDAPRRVALPLARLGAAQGEVLVATSGRAGAIHLAELEVMPLEGIALRLG